MSIKGAKILITGGAGFIGSHIVDSLVKSGNRVIVYDNFSSGNIGNLKKSIRKIQIVKGDILDYPKIEKVMKGVDFVSHHAAQLEIFKAESDPLFDLRINTIGTLNILKSAKYNRIRKIINASSACVYGQPISKIQDENHPTNPNWSYGVSKLTAEKYCQIFSKESGIPVTSLRYAIVYGEREWFRRVLTIFLKRAINKQDLIIFGNGNQYRDFVYVKDVVRLHNLCIENKSAENEVFNVGQGKPTTIKKLARIVRKISGINNLRIKYEDVKEGESSILVQGKKRNPQDLKGMCLSSRKAYKILHWKAQTSLVEGITKEFRWAKVNLNRWDKIKYTI